VKTLGLALLLAATQAVAAGIAQEYALGPGSQRQANVPRGTVTHYTWTSKIFSGTVRDFWVYLPAQYKSERPACVMVFQDGAGYIKEDGDSRVPIVLDNLIDKREMPITVGIFINPGVLPSLSDSQQARFDRSFEYDSLGDRYARFLLEEIIPEVAQYYNLSNDPNDRAIAGASSGGICAFTVAWNRPDSFRRVLSFIGSFTDLRGGDVYPALIRKTEPKPLRVLLQDGTKDLNLYAGNWYLANQAMASALEYAGYDVKFVVGTEGHNMKHGGAILPDALRWLWRDYPKPITKPKTSGDRQFTTLILDSDRDWDLVGQGYKSAAGLAGDRDGNVFFSDGPNDRINKIGADGRVTPFKENTGRTTSLTFGPDGRLFACQSGRRRIVAYAPDGTESTIADSVECNSLAITPRGDIYLTDPSARRVYDIDHAGGKRVVYEGAILPGGVQLSPDQSLLAVTDTAGKWVWSFQIEADGSLENGQAFYRLERTDESSATRAGGMTVDSQGFLYVATELGIQVCDQPGRVVAIINSPAPGPLSSIVLAGPDLEWLFASTGDKVFRRRIRRKGVPPAFPVKPPNPQL